MDRARITERLHGIAAAHGVQILFAAESGSRAWGFASTDSDYDIRFIYRHPTPWYLALDDQRDVIELPLDADGLDVAGWDLRKALRLLLRSNPPLHEWLASPIPYIDRDGFGAALRALFEQHAAPRRLAQHYLSMARGQRDLLGPRPLVRRKRYLYIARPLVAWLLLRQGTWPPPMAMPDLLAGASVPPPVLNAIEALIAEKQAGAELGEGPRIAVLEEWMRATLDQADPTHLPDTAQAPDGTAVQAFFMTVLRLAEPARSV